MKSAQLVVFLVSGVLAATILPYGEVSAGEQEDQFEIVANLQNPGYESGRPAFESAVLRFPWVYALAHDWDLRSGRLYVFKIPQTVAKAPHAEDRVPTLEPVKVIENVGDGYYMSRWDNLIVCTRDGGIELFSPDKPQELTRVGGAMPLSKKKYRSVTIARDGNRAYVIGRSVVLTYDLSDPARPRCLAEAATGYYGFAGCISNGYLYVGCEKKQGGENRPGIVVIDPTEPTKLKELAFVPVSQAIYHLFVVPGLHMIACLDGDSLRYSGCPDRKSALLDIANPARPSLVKEFKYRGGRAATIFSTAAASYLIGETGVFLVRGVSLVDVYSYWDHPSTFNGFPSTFDGFPYRGDSDDTYVALPGDQGIVLLKHCRRSQNDVTPKHEAKRGRKGVRNRYWRERGASVESRRR